MSFFFFFFFPIVVVGKCGQLIVRQAESPFWLVVGRPVGDPVRAVAKREQVRLNRSAKGTTGVL